MDKNTNFFIFIDMYSLKIKLCRNMIIFYENDLPQSEFKKINEIHCNVDIYEELIPFKYIIKKIDNNLYYESFSFLFNNNIEK